MAMYSSKKKVWMVVYSSNNRKNTVYKISTTKGIMANLAFFKMINPDGMQLSFSSSPINNFKLQRKEIKQTQDYATK